MRSVVRILAVAALVPWLAVSAALAREHVHESDAAGHASLVHSHFAPHDQEGRHLDLDHHHGAEIGGGDAHVVWLDQVGIAPAAHGFTQFLFVLSTPIIIAPPPVRHVAVAADETSLPHGPPRASLSLRAPPSVFL